MPYSKRIETLTESHRLLDNAISEMMKNPNFDELKVTSMKKQKLIYRDELRRLERAQWEEQKETTNE